MKTNIFTLLSKPGIKRDGTNLDNEFYQDGQWVRFMRGRPRKIGGYRAMSTVVTGPVRAVDVSPRATNNLAHLFSPWGVQQLEFDVSGAGSGLLDRTPVGLAYNANYNWQVDSMWNSGGGGAPVLVCASAPDLDSIAGATQGGVYSGNVTAGTPLVAIADGTGPIQVSGGCCVLQPFLFVYGNDGLIRNSNANDFSVGTGWAGVNANTANVSAHKVVKGLPVRGGGNSPAGLFWALDSLIRVSYVGGTALWKYDPVSSSITVLSKSAICEYDGVYYWPGVDRFYVYTGVVQELRNDMSLNYFYENLNYAQAQKVWALKVPRFGEIWWFFPFGASTECDAAIIYNVREQTWYDARLYRTAGASSQVFRFPVMAGGEPLTTTLLSYTVGVGTFAAGMDISGGTSLATGRVVRVLSGQLNVTVTSGAFINGEVISNSGATATGTVNAAPASQQLDTLWQHEYGYDRVSGESVTAIESYFETNNFQWASGGPVEDAPQGSTLSTRVTRLEPDFLQQGELTVTVKGKKYAHSPDISSPAYPFNPDTEYIALREQRRQMALKVASNVQGGFYEMGKNFVTVEPGDERA